VLGVPVFTPSTATRPEAAELVSALSLDGGRRDKLDGFRDGCVTWREWERVIVIIHPSPSRLGVPVFTPLTATRPEAAELVSALSLDGGRRVKLGGFRDGGVTWRNGKA